MLGRREQDGSIVYEPSRREIRADKLFCPRCDEQLEPCLKINTACLKCFACGCELAPNRLKNLPDNVLAAFEQGRDTMDKLDELKGVVDQLQARGALQEAWALSAIITAATAPSETVLPASVVEAMRILNVVEAEAGTNQETMGLATKTAILKQEILKATKRR